MKRTRAVHHLRTVAESCADMATRSASIFPLQVIELWAAGDILEPVDDLERVKVALVVDLPPDEVAWLTQPHGAEHWSFAAKITKAPVTVRWRSARAPVWNHDLVRPVLIWDPTDGIAEQALQAIADQDAEHLRQPEPPAELLTRRLGDDLAVSRRALSATTARYTERRWGPGELTPLADAMCDAGTGYLDLLHAVESTP